MGAMDFWDKPDQAKAVVAQFKLTKAQIEPLKAVIHDFEEAHAVHVVECFAHGEIGGVEHEAQVADAPGVRLGLSRSWTMRL